MNTPTTTPESDAKRTLLIPKQPPPRPGTRSGVKFTIKKLPVEGDQLTVTCGQEIYAGKVVFCTKDRIRLRDGAGFWDINVGDITDIAVPTNGA